MKRVFLLDYENTAVRGLDGISELGPEDKVVVFCSNENIRRSLYDLLKIYEERSVEIRVHLLKKRASNALDFMITTYLGFEVSMEEKKEIFVISADKGYESAIDMAHELSNGIFIGFHQSIFECIHEKYSRALEQKEDDVFTIEADETQAVEKAKDKQQIDGRPIKSLSGPVGSYERSDSVAKKPYDKSKGFGAFIWGTKHEKSSTKKQRDEYRLAFLDRIISEGKIPAQYANQLTAFMEKSADVAEFRERAEKALGFKNKEYLGIAASYYNIYVANRP